MKAVIEKCEECSNLSGCSWYPVLGETHVDLAAQIVGLDPLLCFATEHRLAVDLSASAGWWLYDAQRSGGHVSLETLKSCPYDQCPFKQVDAWKAPLYVPWDNAYKVGAGLWVCQVGREEDGLSTQAARKRALTLAAKRPVRDPEEMAKELLERIGVQVVDE